MLHLSSFAPGWNTAFRRARNVGSPGVVSKDLSLQLVVESHPSAKYALGWGARQSSVLGENPLLQSVG